MKDSQHRLFPEEPAPAGGQGLFRLDLSRLPPKLLAGTSSFSTDDWRGVFYPANAAPREYLRHYAAQFRTVEIDATFYAIPSARTVQGWARRTPGGFVFAAKVPREITHERGLVDCAEPWNRFLRVMEGLGPKLGPLLFQFPYVAKGKDPEEHRGGADFLRRLAGFLPHLPAGGRFAVEVRNESWIGEPLLSLLAGRGIALAWADYYTMPSLPRLLERCDPVTASFGYARFLGNHKAMDERVRAEMAAGRRAREWEALLLDRTRETEAWVPALRGVLPRLDQLFLFYNNHYAGFAPGSVELLRRTWEETTAGEPPSPSPGRT